MKKYVLAFLTLLCTYNLIYAQRTVQGTVSDPAGGRIIGANIIVKGTTIGTVSDLEGKFKLVVPSDKNILVISYTGFESKEIELTIFNQVDVILNKGVQLEMAIVTALGIRREEKSLGYATSRINSEDISQVISSNFVNELEGRAAGVSVMGSAGGNMGGSSRITIRGIRSINGENQPLFVVDGIPMDNSNFTNLPQVFGNGSGAIYQSQNDYGNAIQDINPNDIENINVLKGQAAAALYGSRGANGVIIITSKKGSKSKHGIGITFNSSVTFDNVAVFPKIQNQYGGGVDLLPRGYSDNSGFYKTKLITYNPDGSINSTYQTFDLVPIYGVDESSGVRFATSTDQHFKHLESLKWDSLHYQFSFPNGFGANQNKLFFRDWNSWDNWDTSHFGKSRLWQVGDNPIKYFETGVTSSQNIAIDGGNEISSFRLSYNRYDQKGIFPNSNMQRNTISFNGSLHLTPSLQAFVGANYVKSNSLGRAAVTFDFRGGFNPLASLSQWWHTDLRFADLMSYENPDGSMRTWNRQSADNPRPQYWDNPYWVRYKNYETDGRDRVFGNVGLTYKFNSWLSATGRVLTDFYDEFREERIAFGSLLLPQYTLDKYHVNETNTDLIVKADKYIRDNLSVSVFGGANKLWRKTVRNFGATVGGMNIPDIYNLQNSVDRPIIENTLYQKEIESLFGGVSFGFASKLFLDLTGRQDWSSTLPDNANGYFYPSASLAYVFSEDFKIPKLSFGKFRIGLAKVGGDTDPYNIFTTYNHNPSFGNIPNYTLSNTLNNEQLKSEQTSSIEIGSDLRFFNDRLGIDISLYSGMTNNQIIPLHTSTTTGFDYQYVNAGEISNKGIELVLRAIPYNKHDFKWEIIFNYGLNRNKIESILPNDPSITNLPLASDVVSINALIGKSYGTILGTNFLFDNAGNKLIDPNTGYYLVSPGVMPIGNITPDFIGGFTNTFSWKGLSLKVFIDFRKGGDVFSITNTNGKVTGLFAETAEGGIRENGILYNGILAVLDSNGNPILDGGGNTATLLDDTYISSGQKNTKKINYDYYKFHASGYYINKQDLYDGSFIKLREVSLSYTIPKRWLAKVKIIDATISIVGRNLAILYKNLPNLDPDMATSTNNIYGFEGAALPSTRSIGCNLNFRF